MTPIDLAPLRKAFDRFRPAADPADAGVDDETVIEPPLGPRFSVSVSGPGGGATRHLGEGEFVVGNAISADLVLPALAEPEVMLLRLESHGPVGTITVVPLVPGLRLRDRTLPVGVPVPAGDRATVSVGPVELALSCLEQPAEIAPAAPKLPMLPIAPGMRITRPSPQPIPARMRLPVVLMLLAAALAAMGFGGWRMTQAVLGGLERLAADSGPATDRAARDLNRQVSGGWLGDKGQVQVRDNAVVLRGRITAEEGARVQDVIAGVRKRNSVPVIAELTLQDGPAATQVAAVLLSPRKLVVGRDGRHYGIGDKLPDGTLVAGIDEDSARFVRDGLEETLRF